MHSLPSALSSLVQVKHWAAIKKLLHCAGSSVERTVMLQSLYNSLSLGLLVSPGAAQVSLVAYSASELVRVVPARVTCSSSVLQQERVACTALPANLSQDQPGFVVFHILSLKFHYTQPSIYDSPWSVHALSKVICSAAHLSRQYTNHIILVSKSSPGMLSTLIFFNCSKLFPLILTRMHLQPQQNIILN